MLRSLLLAPGAIKLEETETPTPSRGELLVKVEVALTCGTDLKAYLRGHPVIPMPGPFGHEFSGMVAKAGKGVRKFREGDEIMSVHSAPCLECAYCRRRLYNLCEKIMETKVLGAFAEYLLLPSHIVRQNAWHKPQEISFEEAALLEPLACVVHGLESLEVRPGGTALVIGAGPIGLIHTMLLKHQGAVVCVSDTNAARLKSARDLGSDLTVKPGAEGRALKALTGGMGFDHAFECTGRPGVWEGAVAHLRRGGTLVLFGGCPSGTRVSYDTRRLHYDEITLKGVFHFTPADVRRARNLLCSGELNASRLISGSYGLGDLEKAFSRLATGQGIKYAIKP